MTDESEDKHAKRPAPTVARVLRGLIDDLGYNTFDELWTFATEWPPDAYAIAYILLSNHAIYRTAVSDDEAAVPTMIDRGGTMGGLWPNSRQFTAYVRSIGESWRQYADGLLRDRSIQPSSNLSQFFAEVGAGLSRLLACPLDYAGAHRNDHAVLFCVAAAADEACVGLGLPGPAAGGTTQFALEAELRLVKSDHGSLSRFSRHLVRVLPKLHTPQRGITLRSFSHHVCATTQDFGVNWTVYGAFENTEERLNLLLFPWPLEVSDRSVSPAKESLPGPWGYFNWAPPCQLDVEFVATLVKEAKKQGFSVDGVVLPEAAITEAEASDLFTVLDLQKVKFVLTGIRGERRNTAQLHVIGGFMSEQAKHHRWCLDRRQIEQYDFQRVLNPHIQWWENIRLAPRSIGFVALWSWLTLCHVICEDLARLDPVDQIIRAVGPNLLIALLQDGPQLRQRWGARYATVYTDDPGTSVLTLTSLGMATAARPPAGASARRVIALWSDPETGTQELELEAGAKALWVSICARRVVEFAADGRSDGGMASRLILVDHQSIKA